MRKNKHKKISRSLYWIPRIFSIVFILFISMFALDVFGTGLGFWETIFALFMHLIPSFVLIVFLIFAWKWEWVGSLGFFLFGIWYIIMLTGSPFEWYKLAWAVQFSGIAFVIGFLFFLNWKRKKH